MRKWHITKAWLVFALCVMFAGVVNITNVQAAEAREPYYHTGKKIIDATSCQIVESITIHEGETLLLAVGDRQEDGTYLPGTSHYVSDMEWAITLDCREYYSDIQLFYSNEYLKVWSRTVGDDNYVYIKGLKATGDCDDYWLTFFDVSFDVPDISLPITVLPAEVGVTYETYGEEKPEDLFGSLEEAYEYVRNSIRNREVINYTLYIPSEEVAEFDGFEGVCGFYSDQIGWEADSGDYMYHTGVGFSSANPDSVGTSYQGVQYGAITFERGGWDYYTTAEQERWVDNKMAELFGNGGTLAYLKNASEYEKVAACMNYIRNNVTHQTSYTSIYHSAYSALYNGTATCEGLALLYDRMLAEVGVSSRVLMGQDAGAHTYNLVLLDGKYYYCDPTTGETLKGKNNFVCAPLQEHYLTERFQNAILNRISNEDYPAAGSAGGSESGTASTYTGLAQGDDGNWYLYENGAVNWSYNGLYCDANVGWWLVQNGTVAFAYSGLYYDTTYGWWLINGGSVNFGYSGLYYDTTYGWWLINGGSVNFGYSGLYCDAAYGWWLINGGSVNFGYSGLYCDAAYGWWLINGGSVNFGYSGLYCDEVCGWWLINGGSVNFDYTGLYNDAVCGWWLVNGGTIDFAYTGTVYYEGIPYQVVNGQLV